MTTQISLGRVSISQVREPEHSHASRHLLFDRVDLNGVVMPFNRNVEVYGEGEPADYIYKVISGTVRTYKVLNDGRRQIGAFYLPGDMFGLESGAAHAFSAEAITSAKVMMIRRSTVAALAARDNSVAQQLLAMTGRELARVQDHLTLLIKTAQERVAGFLLEMAERAQKSTEVELPMSRQDIADYLGLTIETVSRTLTQLEVPPRSRCRPRVASCCATAVR